MVPIVSFEKQEGISDKRKLRKTSWKEAKLCFARKPDNCNSFFSATIGSPDELGDKWLSAAIQMGFGYSTNVHCLGDGAAWIKDQSDRIFGSNGEYLIDFYHLSEYLFAAGEQIAPDEPKEWLLEQQERMKKGNLYLVLQELETHLYSGKDVGLEKIRTCYRYITNRLYQLDYLGALIQELPIGSGEIESAHRHVIQKRIKKSGAWWKVENAEAMLQLLTMRANGLWDEYWKSYQLEEIRDAA